ncbi:hypothetical protein SOVF_006590, partial [Spinacia oleracea]
EYLTFSIKFLKWGDPTNFKYREELKFVHMSTFFSASRAATLGRAARRRGERARDACTKVAGRAAPKERE